MITIPYYETSHFVFSNFSAHAVVYEGYEYPTVEHAFHSQKFDDAELREQIRTCKSPLEAWTLGTNADDKKRKGWNDIQVDVMTAIITQKVNQHPEVKDALLATGAEVIIEDNPHDDYWGNGANGKGQNMTGQILMQIRQALQHTA